MYSIGKLAELSNITVRTLRYYDEVELLKPTKVSDGGHRYYDSKAVEKLQNIMMLKDIGFELETIYEILANQVKSTKELLQMRLKIIQVEKEQLAKSEQRIHKVLRLMEVEGTSSWEQIFDTFIKQKKKQAVMEELRRNYFTDEELTIIESLPIMGSDDPLAIKWEDLIKDIKSNMHNDPTSQVAQELIKRWWQLVGIMFKGNWELAHKTWKINWKKEEDLGFYEFDPDLMNYIGNAQAYYMKQNKVGPNDE